MRSTLLIGCLLWALVCVHSMRIEHFIQKRAASPQIYQGVQGGSLNQTQQFQWVKVNNQWVRRDGSNKLPGYSDPNVPYNQAGKQPNTPTPVSSRPASPVQSSGGNQPKRQDSTGSVGWNPSADRALTEDLPKTTPRTTTTSTTTTTTTRAPQRQTPPTVKAPFGSGMGGQQKPQLNRYNPDASLTYGGLPPPTNKANVRPTPAKGSNPWGNLSR